MEHKLINKRRAKWSHEYEKSQTYPWRCLEACISLRNMRPRSQSTSPCFLLIPNKSSKWRRAPPPCSAAVKLSAKTRALIRAPPRAPPRADWVHCALHSHVHSRWLDYLLQTVSNSTSVRYNKWLEQNHPTHRRTLWHNNWLLLSICCYTQFVNVKRFQYKKIALHNSTFYTEYYSYHKNVVLVCRSKGDKGLFFRFLAVFCVS